jgi:hypothetical protein
MYASDSIYGHSYSKWDTIQEDVSDMYINDVEEDSDEEYLALDEIELEELEMEMM